MADVEDLWEGPSDAVVELKAPLVSVVVEPLERSQFGPLYSLYSLGLRSAQDFEDVAVLVDQVQQEVQRSHRRLVRDLPSRSSHSLPQGLLSSHSSLLRPSFQAPLSRYQPLGLRWDRGRACDEQLVAPGWMRQI